MTKAAAGVLLVALAATVPAYGGAGQKAGHGHATSFGIPGKPADAMRTVDVVMTDNEYNIPSIIVKAGETIRFVVKNNGEFLHEFNIGTVQMHEAHQHEMIAMFEQGMIDATSIKPDMKKMDHSGHDLKAMKHDDPNSVLLEPGKSAELVWNFSKAGHLEFACNVPGHYQLGMVGTITVTGRSG